jgi:hypothetical protein
MDKQKQTFQMVQQEFVKINDGIIAFAKKLGKEIAPLKEIKLTGLPPEKQMFQMVKHGLDSIANSIAQIEVPNIKDGYTPKPGVDYLSAEETRRIIKETTPRKRVDYFTDAEVIAIMDRIQKAIVVPEAEKVDYDQIKKAIRSEVSKIPQPKDGEPGKDAVVDYERIVFEVIGQIILPDPEAVDYDAIKKFIKDEIKKLPKPTASVVRQFVGGRGATLFSELDDVDMTDVEDGNIPIWHEADGKWKPGISTDSDEKVKLNASDPTAGYLEDKLEDVGIVTDSDNVKTIQFDTEFTDGHAEGRLQWNKDDGTLEVGMQGGNVNLQIGQEQLIRVRNDSGVDIKDGEAVYISGSTGAVVRIALARADDDDTANVAGLATEDIDNNSFGYITSNGIVRDVNTNGFTAGDMLYLSANTAGAITNIEPEAPNCSVHIGTCIVKGVGNGSILVRPVLTPHFTQLCDVNGTALTTDGQIPTWHNTEKYFDFDKNINDYALTDDLNIANWNTAYGWGNHADAGYLLSSTASSTYVPYTGATADIALGDQGIRMNKRVSTTGGPLSSIEIGSPSVKNGFGAIINARGGIALEKTLANETLYTFSVWNSVGSRVHAIYSGTTDTPIWNFSNNVRGQLTRFYAQDVSTTAGVLREAFRYRYDYFYIYGDDGARALFRLDRVNDRLGINTATPLEALHITGNLFLNDDSNKIFLGAGKDASIYYDGTDLNINTKEVGSGTLKINGVQAWSGTFTNGDGDTVTVTDGLITSVV